MDTSVPDPVDKIGVHGGKPVGMFGFVPRFTLCSAADAVRTPPPGRTALPPGNKHKYLK